MTRCLLIGAALCFPAAMYAESSAVSPAEVPPLLTEMLFVKQKFLELRTEMDILIGRIKVLEVENHRLKERLNELETDIVHEDLSSRVSFLEGQVVEIEARISGPWPSAPPEESPDDDSKPTESPLNRSFVASMDDSGRLISLYRRQIDMTQEEILVPDDDCEMVGAWFEERFAIREYNAFFVHSDRGVRVCEKLAYGWRSLRAHGATRAHLITEPY